MAVSTPFPALHVLYTDIEARVNNVRSTQEDWPCRKGCDHCCRHLAEPPRATQEEWQAIQVALGLLTQEVQNQTAVRIDELDKSTSQPTVCPFLQEESGSCSIYSVRPTACRTYGFYVERDQGLYCDQIRENAEAGLYEHVVWGNGESINARLQHIGPLIDLRSWWAEASPLFRPLFHAQEHRP